MLTAFLLGLSAAPGSDGIWDKLEFYANGRMRLEETLDQNPSGEDRFRGRMRVRAGVRYDITDALMAEARLSTASAGGDSNNPHWDWGNGGDGFNGADVVFDRYFLSWICCETAELRVGKQGYPFQTPPVFGELAWDDDVSPSGAALIWKPKSEGKTSFDVRLMEMVADENSTTAEPSVTGVQGNVNCKVSDRTTVHLASSYEDWHALEGTFPGNQGNTATSFDDGFAILNSHLDATFAGGPLGQTQAFAQMMDNMDDEDGEDSGFAFGLKLGKSKEQGDHNVFATYFDLDANSVFSPVAQDDTPITGTGVGEGMSGLIAGWQYFWRSNAQIRVWGLMSEADTADEDPWRLRVDLDFQAK
jgi:hypothetical protein